MLSDVAKQMLGHFLDVQAEALVQRPYPDVSYRDLRHAERELMLHGLVERQSGQMYLTPLACTRGAEFV